MIGPAYVPDQLRITFHQNTNHLITITRPYIVPLNAQQLLAVKRRQI